MAFTVVCKNCAANLNLKSLPSKPTPVKCPKCDDWVVVEPAPIALVPAPPRIQATRVADAIPVAKPLPPVVMPGAPVVMPLSLPEPVGMVYDETWVAHSVPHWPAAGAFARTHFRGFAEGDVALAGKFRCPPAELRISLTVLRHSRLRLLFQAANRGLDEGHPRAGQGGSLKCSKILVRPELAGVS